MPMKYFDSDGIIFASSCENMPNILLESMASGKPIACSNKGPMPEFLNEGGIYFNPDNTDSIVASIIQLINSNFKNFKLAKKNINSLNKYNWRDTSFKTFNLLTNILSKNV